MQTRERATGIGARIGVAALGGLLVVIGWGMWSFERDTSSLPYRVLENPAGGYGAYWVEDTGDSRLEIEATADESFQVVDASTPGRAVVFTGTEAEASLYVETRGATTPRFTGTREEVDAWVSDQMRAEDDQRWPIAVMVVGGVLLLAAAWIPRSRRTGA